MKASLSIELNVTCPECDHFFDLISETDLNDEGQLMESALPYGDWYSAHQDFHVSVDCPECSAPFDVNGIDW